MIAVDGSITFSITFAPILLQYLRSCTTIITSLHDLFSQHN